MKTNNTAILSARIPLHLLFTKEVKRKRRISGDNYLRTPDILGLEQPYWGKFSPLLAISNLLRHTPESWKFVVTQ